MKHGAAVLFCGAAQFVPFFVLTVLMRIGNCVRVPVKKPALSYTCEPVARERQMYTAVCWLQFQPVYVSHCARLQGHGRPSSHDALDRGSRRWWAHKSMCDDLERNQGLQ